MALHSVKGYNTPESAVPLSKSEAVEFQKGLMMGLSPAKDRIFVTHGPVIASSAVAYTSISTINTAFRITGLGKTVRMRIGLPFGVLPSILTLGFHKALIRDNIIIDKWACPACYHLRSAFIQVLFASIIPTFFGGYFAFASARRYRLPGIPPLNHRKEIMQCVRERIAPFSKKLKILAVANFFLGGALAHLEAFETNRFNQNFAQLATEYHRKSKQS